jgi:ribosome-associated translation inhibitor RaiA
MKIDVTDIAGTFGRQTQAYAEYRVFSSLAYFSDIVREAAVSLTPAVSGHSVVCSVLISLENGVPVRITTRGRHAYDAITRVAHRIAPALRRHTRVALSS